MKRLLALLFVASSALGQSASPSLSVPAIRQRVSIPALTPDESKALVAAAQKARQDPKVQVADEKMREAMKAVDDAMVAKDKALALLIAKAQGSLSASERQQLLTARQAMNGTPEKAASQKASADYHAAVTQAMIAADPSIVAIIERLSQGNGNGARRSVSFGIGATSPAALPSATPH
jgi:hypothetical protein